METCKLLFVFSHSPYGSSIAKEGLEAALAGGAFDQDIGIFFTGDGVYQLLNDQQSGDIARKSHQKMMQALPMFGIEKFYADKTSMNERGINESRLSLAANLLAPLSVAELMSQADHILSF